MSEELKDFLNDAILVAATIAAIVFATYLFCEKFNIDIFAKIEQGAIK